MDRQTILNHLAQAHRYVAQGREHIANQREIIARLQRHGLETTKAREMLQIFEAMQAMHLADCKRLQAALRDGHILFTTGEDIRRADSTCALSLDSKDELRWYQDKIAEATDAYQRSKDAVETSREILLNLPDAAAGDLSGRPE